MISRENFSFFEISEIKSSEEIIGKLLTESTTSPDCSQEFSAIEPVKG